MKNVLLISLLVCFLSTNCTFFDEFNCSDCSNKDTVLNAANKIYEKRLGQKHNSYETRIEESIDFYEISYHSKGWDKGAYIMGGGMFLKISKKDCKIVEIHVFK